MTAERRRGGPRSSGSRLYADTLPGATDSFMVNGSGPSDDLCLPYDPPLAPLESVRATRQLWRRAALARIAELAVGPSEFTVDDLAGALPKPAHPADWGTVLRIAVEARVVVAVGTRTALRPGGRRSEIRVWRGRP